MRLIIILSLLVTSFVPAFSSEQVVKAAFYNPVRGQCYGNPLITADGSKINLSKLKSRQIRWIAMSRDLLKSGYKMGDTIEVECDHNFFRGKWIIKDKMGARNINSIDFLLHPKEKHRPPRKVKIKKS